MQLARRSERLVRALQDSLCADVDPTPCRHLSVHRQPERLETAELVPRRPARDEQRVGDQDTRRSRMRPEDPHRLAALDEQTLVLAKLEQRAHDGAQSCGISCRLTRAPVDNELLRALGNLAVEVVQKHPQRGLGGPAARAEPAPARGADARQVTAELVDDRFDRTSDAHASSPISSSTAATSEPSRIASATASMSGASGRSSPSLAERDRMNACVARTPSPGSRGARNSTPCAPASNSIASARSEFASTCQALRPEAFPMET